MAPLRTLDLFSGIGGFSLGLQRAGGFETVAFCEIDPFCRKVLAKHWPNVPAHEDVRGLSADDVGPIDIIVGGFPCQQTSVAAAIHGKREGLAGHQSGHWFDMLRLVRDGKPLWVAVENPPGVHPWADTIHAGLEGAGYAVARSAISASAVGAPHRRRRFIFLAHPDSARLEIARSVLAREDIAEAWPAPPRGLWRETEPGTWRMDDGVSHRVDRLRALGNAIMPAKAEAVGRAIQQAEREVPR